MNIRWKVTALIAALFAVLGVAELFVARNVLMPSFTELESSEAHIAMRRVQYGMDLTLDQLALTTGSWGNWTDAYRFAQDHNRTFVAENVTAAGLKQLNVNTLIFVDPAGHFSASAAGDPQSGREFDLDLRTRQELAADFPWRANLRAGRPAQGLLQTNRGILMVAAAPVLDGYGHGPARGMVMLGRLLSAAEIQRIGAHAQAKLSMLPPQDSGNQTRLFKTADVIHVYRTLNDLYGRPIMTLRVDVPREITRRGYSAVNYASVYLMAAAVMVVMLLVVILNRVVLSPLALVTRHAVAIGEGKDLTTRLDFKGEDEIGVLAREFDRMVTRVAESRSQLVDQSFEAGFAELAKGVLHNLGNAMTPIGVRLVGLRARLRSMRAEDAELAVAELSGGDVDPTRRADLQEFIHLACAQLASTVRAAEEDVEVMIRQTSIVQSALAEQMRSTRNEHVIEAVRLPELLAQSLDVVPDSARQRLSVEADKSLQEVGVVHIPRTVLRLVLQNFIINAADSVRESGKPRGSLRIAAEILYEANHQQLCLHCTDDGAGIITENLERIFEKGFTTKSRETNFGIGLHWCANSLRALGGRVWATSRGTGYGASLHLMVPLPSREDMSIIKAA